MLFNKRNLIFKSWLILLLQLCCFLLNIGIFLLTHIIRVAIVITMMKHWRLHGGALSGVIIKIFSWHLQLLLINNLWKMLQSSLWKSHCVSHILRSYIGIGKIYIFNFDIIWGSFVALFRNHGTLLVCILLLPYKIKCTWLLEMIGRCWRLSTNTAS